MKWFYDLKISKKLILSYLLVALIAGMVGYVGITRIKAIQQTNEEVTEKREQVQNELTQIVTGFERRRVLLKDMVISEGYQQRAQKQQAIVAADNQESQYMASLKKDSVDNILQPKYESLEAALEQYAPVKDEYIRLVLAGNIEQARYITSTGRGVEVANAVYQALDNYKTAINQQSLKLLRRNNEVVQQAIFIMVSLIILNVALALLLGWLISKTITRPLEAMLLAADRLAVGDIQVKVEVESEDEIGMLARSFSSMIDNIKDQADIAEHLAVGDMAIEVKIKSKDDLLGNRLNEVVVNLHMLIDEIEKMHENQKAGDIEALIAADRFQGAYRDLAEGINQVVELHVRNVLSILNILSAYAEGDFSPVLEKLPGKQAIANEKMDLLRENLLAVINEIVDSSKSAIDGQLEHRADSSLFRGDYARIINGLNEVIEAVANPIREIGAILQGMAEGRLNHWMNGEYSGDYSEIQSAINNTVETLNEVLGEINQIAEQVAIGAGLVAESSQALSQASTEQAASVQEITATMNAVASQTRQNALNASRAVEMAATVKENAEYGNGEMKEMLQAMAEINESSAKISKIIKVIDEIAFQTNILALNAAVEAARAGQHGKGFAVVAEEVRNLAARSANAAKETTAMIEGSINNVEAGCKIANETAVALNKISDGVSNVADLINEIASASDDQATAINQINVGIGEISEVTQMNTATSEESAASSEELANRADLLKKKVSRFTLDRRFLNDQSKDGRIGRTSQVDSNNENKMPLKPISINLDDTKYK